jgi:hypothetical protein
MPEITESKLIIHFQHSIRAECPAASDLSFPKKKTVIVTLLNICAYRRNFKH